jgi:hypothetical protein
MKKYLLSLLLITSCLTPVFASKDEDFSDEKKNPLKRTISQTEGNIEDTNTSNKIIKIEDNKISQEENKKESLIFKGNENNPEILRQIAEQENHPDQFNAAWALHEYCKDYLELFTEGFKTTPQKEENEKVWKAYNYFIELSRSAVQTFKFIAQKDGHEVQYEIAEKLSKNKSKENQQSGRSGLRSLALKKDHKDQHNAVRKLHKSPHQEDHEFVRNLIPQIVGDESYDEEDRKSYIGLLRESNDQEDQKLGLELQLKYFPVKYSEELKKKMAQFNPTKFKETAGKLHILKDLSELKMDLPKEFKKLIDTINSKDEKDPTYLHISTITGKKYSDTVDNEKAFIALRNNTMGFLKTLVGEKVEEGEKADWQMYEENKPALINTLKHLVIALQDTSDTATRLNNIGIILNGLLYCPSGQSEGINSAVNTVIYGRNMTRGSYQDDGVCFEETLGRLVFESMNTAFRKAFGQEGGVHALSRARTVLHPYIGLPQAIEGFKEKISRVADEEIPGILEDFHKAFTKDLIATHILKNTETESDMKLKEEARVKVKQERPLLITQMTAWLSAKKQDLSEYGIDSDLGDDGKVTMNLSIQPSHIIKILETLRYLNQ